MMWQEMTGEERYRVVEMARKGQTSIGEICETFGVSRQTLSKAIEKANLAAVEALSPKKPGRKGKSEEAQQITTLSKQTSSLEKEVDHWKTRYEVAQAYIEITRDAVTSHERAERQTESNRRKRERQKQSKKKRHSTIGAITGQADSAGPSEQVADDGAGKPRWAGAPRNRCIMASIRSLKMRLKTIPKLG